MLEEALEGVESALLEAEGAAVIEPAVAVTAGTFDFEDLLDGEGEWEEVLGGGEGVLVSGEGECERL